jgi:predicted Zn finger-like uncharacterized protein
MQLVCPSCATTYEIPLASLGAGRQVRCSSCKNAWFATAERLVEEAVALPVPVAAAGQELVPQPPAFNFAVIAGHPVQEILPPEPAAVLAIIDAPPLVPHDPAETGAAPTMPKFEPGVPEETEAVVTRKSRQNAAHKEKRGALQRVFSLPMLIVAMLAIVLGALNWRVGMVRHFPQTASLYAVIGLPVNLRGLYFEDVKSRSETQEGAAVLVIEGTIVNLTTRTQDVPRLRFALRNASGQEVYAWTAQPPKPKLGSGNGLPFRARLAAPPADGSDVIVRFLTRRDLAAGSL